MSKRNCRSSKALSTNSRLCKSIWDRFRKEYVPTLNNRQKWQSTTNGTLKEGDLVCWLIKNSYETIDGSEGMIRSAIVRTNDGVYKRPVVKFAPVLLGKDVILMENRACDVVSELINLTTRLKSTSGTCPAVN